MSMISDASPIEAEETKYIFPRKESRPRLAVSGKERRESRGGDTAIHPRPALAPPGRDPGRDARGGKAPFICGAKVPSLLMIPLITLLLLSFHPGSSPAMAAGEGLPSFSWPARGEVIEPFRPASGPYGAGGHAGIDISLAVGSEVWASAPGRVSFAGRTPVGICVSLIHEGGFKTTYVSLSDAAVRRGEDVGRGRVLGHSDGSMDRSSPNPHLHFGLFLNGAAVDPLPFLRGEFLDPSKCLFLGPWEDMGAVEAYIERHGGGGLFQWLGGGFKAVGRAVGGFVQGAFNTLGKALVSAWRGTCEVFKAAGRFCAGFYRRLIQPWLAPVCRGVAEVLKAVFSNRFVQAVLAGLAAAVVVCLAVVGVALALGLSLAATITAAVIGAAASIGYAVYYAFSCGDSFSFTSCFLASLTVGCAAAFSSLLLSFMAPMLSVGWSQLGLIGFGKAFLIHGFADSCIYIVFSLVAGREVSPLGVLTSFLIGGLTGGVGKLFTTGLFSGATIQVLAAGWLSSGGYLLSGSLTARVAAYIWALSLRFAEKAAFVFFCGCTGFLADILFRAVTGGRPTALESLLSFAGGALAGGLGAMGGGKGLSGLISRITRGRIKITGDLASTALSKLFSKGLSKGLTGFLRRLTGSGKKLEEGLWSPDFGGDV